MNSFKFIQKALEYEIDRQLDCIESGTPIVQETRQYNEASNKTESMRGKETSQDYRYFKDPDLPSIWISDEFIEKAIANLPEPPQKRVESYLSLGLSNIDASNIAYNKHMGNYFSVLIENNIPAKTASNWLLGPISELANKHSVLFSNLPISAEQVTELLQALQDGTVSSKMAKEVLAYMWSENKSAATVIEEKGLKQLSSEEDIMPILQNIIQSNPKQTEEYRNGKEKLFGFFVGQAMKATKGQANPEVLNTLLRKALNE